MGGRVGVVIRHGNRALAAHLAGCTLLEQAGFTPRFSKGEIIRA